MAKCKACGREYRSQGFTDTGYCSTDCQIFFGIGAREEKSPLDALATSYDHKQRNRFQ